MGGFRAHRDADLSHTHRRSAHRTSDGQHNHGLNLASKLGNEHVTQVVRSGIQRAGATEAQELDESVARAIEERRGGGQPLDDGVRDEMEGTLGHDLSDVRLHTDSDAHDLSEAVNARAFTTGNDVFFKQGSYDPHSPSGKELLAHELTHVVQQREGRSGLDAGEVSDPSDAAEQAAESVGQAVASGGPASTALQGAGVPGVARATDPEDEELKAQTSHDPTAPVHRQEEDETLEAEG